MIENMESYYPVIVGFLSALVGLRIDRVLSKRLKKPGLSFVLAIIITSLLFIAILSLAKIASKP